MPPRPRADPSRKARASSKAAGATGGTLIVLLANLLPEGSLWKRILVLVAPSAAVGLNAFSSWGIAELIAHWNKRKIDKALYRATETTENILKTEGISEEHKTFVRRKLEEFQKIQINNQFAGIMDNQLGPMLTQNVELVPSKNVEQTSAAKKTRAQAASKS